MIKAITNVSVYDFSDYTDDAYVLFSDKIVGIGKMADFEDLGYEITDGKGCLLMPGLVNGHMHIYSAFARGMNVPFHPANFQDILDQLWWKLDRHLDLKMIYDSGIVCAVDSMKNGVTALIDHHASGLDITGSLKTLKKAVCEDALLRGVFAFETSDRFNADQTIEENRRFMADNHTPFTSGLFGLHASMSLSEATLNKVKTALGDGPIHIHVAESEMDQEDCLEKYGEWVVSRLKRHGLLNPGSILAHCLHLHDEELDIIKEQNCVIAINVSSNMNNGVGLPNLRAFRNKGIRVIAGNDGLSSAMALEYQNILFSSHLRDKTPTGFGLDDLKKIINDTYEYASERLGIGLGRIKKGYAADFLLLPYAPPTPMNQSNAMGHLFFGLFPSFKPKQVFVAGQQLVRDYEVNPTLKRKYAVAENSARILWENIEKEETK